MTVSSLMSRRRSSKSFVGHMDSLERHKAELESLILEIAQNYLPQIELLLNLSPASNDAFTAIRILAEIGADMTVFDTLSISALGLVLPLKTRRVPVRRKTTRIGKSGAYLKPLLIQVALAASRGEKHPEIYGKKQALQKRRGKKKSHSCHCQETLNRHLPYSKQERAVQSCCLHPGRQETYGPPDLPREAFEMLARMGFIVSNPSPLSSSG